MDTYAAYNKRNTNFDFRFRGQITLKWKCSKMSFPIPGRDIELRFVTKFGENRPLRSCRKVLWITTQKNSGSADSSQPPFCQNGPIAPKIPWTLSPLDMFTYQYTLACQGVTTFREFWNLVRIGCALPHLFRKDWFFGPKSNYIIGFQPTNSTACENCDKQKNIYYWVTTI